MSWVTALDDERWTKVGGNAELCALGIANSGTLRQTFRVQALKDDSLNEFGQRGSLPLSERGGKPILIAGQEHTDFV